LIFPFPFQIIFIIRQIFIKENIKFKFGEDFWKKNEEKFEAKNVFEVKDIEKQSIDQFTSSKLL